MQFLRVADCSPVAWIENLIGRLSYGGLQVRRTENERCIADVSL